MNKTTLIRIRNGLFVACFAGLGLLVISLCAVWAMVPFGTDISHAWAVTWDAHGTALLGGNIGGFIYGYRRNRSQQPA